MNDAESLMLPFIEHLGVGDHFRPRRSDQALPDRITPQQVEEDSSTPSIERSEYIVEQQEGGHLQLILQVEKGGETQSQSDRAVLALRGVRAHLEITQFEEHLIKVRTDEGAPAFGLAAADLVQGRSEMLRHLLAINERSQARNGLVSHRRLLAHSVQKPICLGQKRSEAF